jgi:hypothetical protein
MFGAPLVREAKRPGPSLLPDPAPAYEPELVTMEGGPFPPDLESMTVKELKALAKERGIPLSRETTTKPEIIDTIAEALAEAEFEADNAD